MSLVMVLYCVVVFFFKQKTAYEMRISDWSSDVCSSDLLERNLEFLANVGSISPYVGLFGTVWGIMGAFQGLGDMKDVTIAVVAPHISEALIATDRKSVV